MAKDFIIDKGERIGFFSGLGNLLILILGLPVWLGQSSTTTSGIPILLVVTAGRVGKDMFTQVILNWIKNRRVRKSCFHHELPDEDPILKESYSAVSFLKWQLVDMGRRKMFWCTRCGRTWIF